MVSDRHLVRIGMRTLAESAEAGREDFMEKFNLAVAGRELTVYARCSFANIYGWELPATCPGCRRQLSEDTSFENVEVVETYDAAGLRVELSPSERQLVEGMIRQNSEFCGECPNPAPIV
jgi:hypothetical protein